MLLLHISDVHFKHPVCGTRNDPDRPYRSAILMELRKQVAKLGLIEAILITGDVSYNGWAQEYMSAVDWLKELGDVCGCPLNRILVVPGNHDVNHQVIRERATVRNAQKAISSCFSDMARLNREFYLQCSDADIGRVLLEPVQAYNEFAARFECQIYLPEQLCWVRELPFEEGLRLRIYGITSTILSGAGVVEGRKDRRGDLFLSRYQMAFEPKNGIINVVLCHHPSEWYIDQDSFEDALSNWVTIHLFGHQHRQRVHADSRFISFYAGAVNPDYYEPGWEPGYNIIRLSTCKDGNNLSLEVMAQVMVWQTNPGLFRPKLYEHGQEAFYHRIPISVEADNLQNISTPTRDTLTNANNPACFSRTESAAMLNHRGENLVFRFWDLKSSRRREIAITLGIISEDDLRLPEAERYARAFLKARDLGMVERLAEEIAKAEENAL